MEGRGGEGRGGEGRGLSNGSKKTGNGITLPPLSSPSPAKSQRAYRIDRNARVGSRIPNHCFVVLDRGSFF
jgi:hypothetical protein